MVNKVKKNCFLILSIIIMFFLIYSPISIAKTETTNLLKTQTKTDNIPIEFAHSENFNIEIAEPTRRMNLMDQSFSTP